MKTKLLAITGLGAMILAQSAFAQSSSNTTIVREAVPQQQKAIVANSPEDLALQEEIRKIRAYNAYVDSQVGVSDEPVTVNPYRGAKIELFEPASPSTSTPARYVSVPNRTIALTPSTTIIRRDPALGATSIHRIEEGDTLYSLAKANCLGVADIQAANAMSDTNIRLGQVITIPSSRCAGTVTTQPGSSPNDNYVKRVMPVPIKVDVVGNNYAVLPKDTLYSIGRQYCVTPGAIAQENGFSTSEMIHPGQILRLPANACIK